MLKVHRKLFQIVNLVMPTNYCKEEIDRFPSFHFHIYLYIFSWSFLPAGLLVLFFRFYFPSSSFDTTILLASYKCMLLYGQNS